MYSLEGYPRETLSRCEVFPESADCPQGAATVAGPLYRFWNQHVLLEFESMNVAHHLELKELASPQELLFPARSLFSRFFLPPGFVDRFPSKITTNEIDIFPAS